MKAGIYYNMSFETYQKIEAVNNSALKILADQSPAHCKWYVDNGRQDTESLAFGRAADCYILEPTLFAKKYVVGPDCRRGTKEWKAFEDTIADGVEILKPDDYSSIISIYNTVSKSAAMRLITGGQSQVVIIWEDKKTGLLCKGRLDYFQSQFGMITDLKTTQSADPERFAKDVFKYGYYQQAAFYCDGLQLALGEKYEPVFAIFAVEKSEPYVCTAFEVGAKTIEAGRIAYRRALDIYKKCLDENNWPPYSDKILLLEMPNWALTTAGFGPEMML